MLDDFKVLIEGVVPKDDFFVHLYVKYVISKARSTDFENFLKANKGPKKYFDLSSLSEI